MFYPLIPIAIIIISAWLSYYISKRAHILLQRNAIKYARALVIFLGIIIFGVVTSLAMLVYLYNLMLGR